MTRQAATSGLHRSSNTRRVCSLCRTTIALILSWLPTQLAAATDHFLVIGGGYNREANQASLEANVLFFQEVLAEQHHSLPKATTFFANGVSREPDVQVLKPVENSRTPATDFLAKVFTFRATRKPVEYRNHRISAVAGPLKPDSIHSSLQQQATHMRAGDRLFVYVTAHGGSAKGRDPHNTTISCWDKQSISVRTFESWLRDVPAEIPVIMVMAQCYCGGFAHAIFDGADTDLGLATQLRVGFFAQQHDLAAAGCRPDIDNDEEYSSYFWGAIAGRSRTGQPIKRVDLDGDGLISLAEAHAYAVTASETIDIPLRTTDCLLINYSRIGNYKRSHDRDSAERPLSSIVGETEDDTLDLASMSGSLRDLAARGRIDQHAIVTALASQLGLHLDDDVSQVFELFAEQVAADRQSPRSRFRRRGGRGSSRRQLLEEISERWPDLGDRQNWRSSDLLRLENQEPLLSELQQLPSYTEYAESQQSRQQSSAEAHRLELRRVKFRRLIQTLESIVLAENLPKLAADDVVARYQAMLQLEQGFLQAPFLSPVTKGL